MPISFTAGFAELFTTLDSYTADGQTLQLSTDTLERILLFLEADLQHAVRTASQCPPG